MKKYIIAIDQGTTSTRAIVFDRNQNIVKIAQKEIKNSFPEPGWVEQDANEIWLSTLSVLAQLFQGHDIKPQDVMSIGITNQRETTVVWDKTTGLPVYNAIVWQSRQTAKIVDRYRNTPKEKVIKADQLIDYIKKHEQSAFRNQKDMIAMADGLLSYHQKQEIPPKPQLTVYTFPARPQDTVSL